MQTSAAWMNAYLEPPASAAEQAELLTRAGFPLEASEEVVLPDGTRDTRQDFELTSNRGDCLCHLGLAREIAAVSGRAFKPPRPTPRASGPAASSVVKVTNREPRLCPLYTARIIKGVKVGPSPAWLSSRLLARGDIPRNNIVDLSNFVLFEYGQPTHVFDLAKLAGPQIIIRRAKPNEPFLPIGEGATEVKLSEEDLVIADSNRAVAVAGVKGGAPTAVSSATSDILIEAATFAPAAVRATSRRMGIASDSSYRFERGVHAGQIDDAADRLAELILELCGGTLCEGAVAAGDPIPPRSTVRMRCDRCRAILGISVTDQQMVDALARLGLEPQPDRNGAIACTIPYPRIDVEREIDLIEEVGRIHGLDHVPVTETLSVRVAAPQSTELARRAVHDALDGMGYVETVTHSLVSEAAAAAFMPHGMQVMRVLDERASAAPCLRPSILPSLLAVHALNRDRGSRKVNLFESAAVFAWQQGKPLETVNLALLHSPQSNESALREVRGVIDRLAQIVHGPDALLRAEPSDRLAWFAPGAALVMDQRVLGTFGLLAPEAACLFDLNEPLWAAEIGLPAAYDQYPPETEARALPNFPSIERDVSAIVDDRLPWIDVKSALDSLRLTHLEAIEFITTFRGKQIGAGRKSLTLRARFRARDRTLTHDEVDPQMKALMGALTSRFAAEIRQ